MATEVIVRVRAQDATVTVTHPDGTKDTSVVEGSMSIGVVQRVFHLNPGDEIEISE